MSDSFRILGDPQAHADHLRRVEEESSRYRQALEQIAKAKPSRDANVDDVSWCARLASEALAGEGQTDG